MRITINFRRILIFTTCVQILSGCGNPNEELYFCDIQKSVMNEDEELFLRIDPVKRELSFAWWDAVIDFDVEKQQHSLVGYKKRTSSSLKYDDQSIENHVFACNEWSYTEDYGSGPYTFTREHFVQFDRRTGEMSYADDKDCRVDGSSSEMRAIGNSKVRTRREVDVASCSLLQTDQFKKREETVDKEYGKKNAELKETPLLLN